MRQISRDPFARSTLMRERTLPDEAKSCDWCGSKRRSNRLYRYFLENDSSARRYYLKGEFCCIYCMRAYHYG